MHENLLLCLFGWLFVLGNSAIQSELRYLLTKNQSSGGDELKCVKLKVPFREKTSTCCRIDLQVKCLPYFIIAGAQKSGTTALSAFLSSHPLVSFHPRKEAHYFDKNASYKKGIEHYLRGFLPWNATSEQAFPPMFGESSPFYIASRHACQRMSSDLPAVKVILLLREPVARAYSEYQMKKRRVEQQNDFISLVNANPSVVYQCLVKFQGLIALKHCLPDIITSHNHYTKFARAIGDLKSAKGVKGVARTCFSKYKEGASVPRRSYKPSNDDHRKLSYGDVVNDEQMHAVVHAPDDDPIDEEEEAVFEVNSLSSLLPRRLDPVSRNDDYFQAKACMGKSATELLHPLQTALLTEAQELNACITQGRSIRDLSIQAVNQAIDRCVSVKGGITSQYIYRSLYAPQIFHCLQYFQRSQVLIIPNERMQEQPEVVIPAVLDFLGLPSKGASNGKNATLDKDFVQEAVQTYFPKFESQTGWRIDGKYDPLPDEMRLELRRILAPYNDMLFKYLGIDPYPEWTENMD